MNQLPVWFLLLSLLLPRVSLLLAYFNSGLTSFSLSGWIPPTVGALIPRVLVLILIFQNRGFSGWLLVHGITMVCVFTWQLDRAGVSCRWHDLRHTFVSRVAESQASDATIMALAGHLSVTMKERYSHVRAEAKRQAVAVLDRATPTIQ
jgi:hypothetical protein